MGNLFQRLFLFERQAGMARLCSVVQYRHQRVTALQFEQAARQPSHRMPPRQIIRQAHSVAGAVGPEIYRSDKTQQTYYKRQKQHSLMQHPAVFIGQTARDAKQKNSLDVQHSGDHFIQIAA